MKEFLKIPLIVSFYWFSVSVPALAQSTTDINSSGTATAGAAVNTYGATQLPNVSSILGTPGPFPGYSVVTLGEAGVYGIPLFKSLSIENLQAMAKTHGSRQKIRVNVVVVDDKAVPPNEDPVKFIDFLPKPGHIVGFGYGQSIGPVQEESLAQAILELKKHTHTRQVLVIQRMGTAGTTRAGTVGITGVLSGLVDGKGVGLAPGFLRGNSTTYAQEVFTFRIIGFDDGPLELPPVTQASPSPQPTPPATNEISQLTLSEKNQEEEVQQPQAKRQPASPQADLEYFKNDGCQLPEFSVGFSRNSSALGNRQLYKIGWLAGWLIIHPECQVQVEGHASQEGTPGYNAALGRSRSRAVYTTLLKIGRDREYDLSDQVLQFVSLGKDFPVSEEFEQNRRVIVRVIGQASGK